MPVNGKTAEQMREEFYESLRREKEAREEWSRQREEEYRRDKEAREEWSRKREEEHRRAKEEMADMRREFRERARERDKEWKRITSEWGRFTNDEGGMVEYEGVAALRDLPEIGGMPVRGIARSFSTGRKSREYDGVIYCEDAMVLLECKRRVTLEHVRKFLDEQLPEFIRDFSPVANGHALYGAVVGAMIDDDARKLAEENGLFAIRIPANRRVEVLNTANARPLTTE